MLSLTQKVFYIKKNVLFINYIFLDLQKLIKTFFTKKNFHKRFFQINTSNIYHSRSYIKIKTFIGIMRTNFILQEPLI